MNLLHNATSPLTTTPAGPSWAEPDLLRAAARAADRNGVRGKVTFYDDGNTWSFRATLSSNRCDNALVFYYYLPEAVSGVSTDRAHSVSEVLAEMAFHGAQASHIGEALEQLLGNRDAAELMNLAKDDFS